MNDIKLVPVTSDNWGRICALNPGQEGSEFVASNAYSIAQSVFEGGWEIRGIEADGTLVGFTMYGYCDDEGVYDLCRFMIAESYQGQGYGKRALRVIIEDMFERYGCDRIYLSTAPHNARGKHVYESAGFVATGESDGEGDDIEDIFCLMRTDAFSEAAI